jgi:transcriptional antiterminator Rof (Rho-off)
MNFYPHIFLILFLLILAVISHLPEARAYTGKSKVCDDIQYLSTACQDAEVLPFELKDKDVAKAAAGAAKNINKEGDVNVTIVTPKEKEKDDGVTVNTYFSEAE